jgi:flagellar protein FliS
MTKDPARAYREAAVRGASPVGLIVILYEEIIRSIRKAQRALAVAKIEDRSNALTHALAVVGHLQTVLDFEKGGALARELSTFYTLARTKLVELNVDPQDSKMEDLAQEFATMKTAWQSVERDLAQENAGTIPEAEEPALVSAQRVSRGAGASFRPAVRE